MIGILVFALSTHDVVSTSLQLRTTTYNVVSRLKQRRVILAKFYLLTTENKSTNISRNLKRFSVKEQYFADFMSRTHFRVNPHSIFA